MQRRNFLAWLGMAAAGQMATAHGATSGTAAGFTKKRIVVIGAGLAGLAAAQTLQQQGHEVVILEARQRVGGRIFTSHKWPDMPLDFGASWIHGVEGNPLAAIADSIKAQRLVTQYDLAATYNTSGRLLSAAEEARMARLRTQVYSALKKAQTQHADTSIRQAVAPLLAQFPEPSEAARFINFILSSEIEQEYAGSAAKLSSYWYDSAKEFAGDDALFPQGYQVITDALAKGLTIELGQTVKAIQWAQSPVQIITQKGKFVADQVVVTLPLGVLQAGKVRFTPALPQNKRNAIQQLGMGVLNKCYLRFSTAFWPDEVDWLEYVPTEHGAWTEWVSFQRVAKQPILLGFNAGDRGRAMEAWSDEQIVADAMQTLRTIYGTIIPDPMDYQITRWASDPFTLGSYSYNPVGATPATRKILAAPLANKVFFSGEATHVNYFGTAHGAYLAGLSAAQQVLARRV